jgi:disulfide bond formation protein DsbB
VGTGTMTLFFALLTVAAQVAVAATIVLTVAGRWSPAAARLRATLGATVGPQALGLAFLVALVATLGSLYLSEVAHFPPCTLCWYQRICMYPLAVILGLAAWRRDLGVRPYALALTALGAPISAYHYLLERFPALESAACDPANPCTVVWVWRFHYLSIPLMAATGFVLIATLLLLARPADAAPAHHDAHDRELRLVAPKRTPTPGP